MEKGTENHLNPIIRVAITGPECTGKSTLAKQLASHYNSVQIPEYAREYIANLGRPYEFSDVKHIAEVQLKQAYESVNRANKIIFFDTYLIITKVWFEVAYGHYPLWIDDELARKTMDLYLLCNTDIPWIADPVRENGGEMREKLYLRYLGELEKLGCNYVVICGTGKKRLKEAVEAINIHFPDLCH
jgi:NadR type nicotinamide-nucleotide adenylyltransferase